MNIYDARWCNAKRICKKINDLLEKGYVVWANYDPSNSNKDSLRDRGIFKTILTNHHVRQQ